MLTALFKRFSPRSFNLLNASSGAASGPSKADSRERFRTSVEITGESVAQEYRP
jgi:hypothetical protein